jgi:hypothetical protein
VGKARNRDCRQLADGAGHKQTQSERKTGKKYTPGNRIVFFFFPLQVSFQFGSVVSVGSLGTFKLLIF